MQGTVVVTRPAARDAASQIRSLFTISLLIFASTLFVVRQTQHDTQTVLKGKMSALEGNVGTERLDPDAPHMRVSNSHLYVPQDDPDAPDGNVESVWPSVLHRAPPLNDHAWFGFAGADDHPAMEGPVPVAVAVDELSRFRLASLSPGTVKYVEAFFG